LLDLDEGKEGDRIAVPPLDHRTTQHGFEQKGKHPSRETINKALPMPLVSDLQEAVSFF
jgi:hypothetical protein